MAEVDVRRSEPAVAPPATLEELELRDPYREWLAREGVEVITDHAFGDLLAVELGPWPRKGGRGAVVNLAGETLLTDAHLVEIAPAGRSEPEHHLYEELVYVLAGHGETTIWSGNRRARVEWGAGALFPIPLNAWYEHRNLSGTEPLRYLAVTNAPPMMRLLADDDAVFDCPLAFPGRYEIDPDFYSAGGRLYAPRVWRSNFVPDAPAADVYAWKERGGGGANVLLEMGGNTSLKPHISEFPVGTYKKAHRHGPGYHLVILGGHGFSLLWTAPDMSDLEKRDWSKNSMVIIPSHACFHQHFNTGTARARYLAIRPGNMGTTAPPSYRRPDAQVSIQEGGWQIEYEDEARQVHELFEAELARRGAPCRMRAFVPWCTGEVGPTDERDT
ncbi:MAG TPA: cupin domain-containing protein [Acidimicrobiales bacterium]|nr:cupin domain-containing protein [Acidimicrobiales bacterium]